MQKNSENSLISASSKIKIESVAPVRVDLAGGTVDIWPLYLLLDQPKTINFGINLFAKTTLEVCASNAPGVMLESIDQKKSQRFTWPEILETQSGKNSKTIPELDLLVRLLQYFAKKHPHPQNLEFTLRTEAKSPAGAGLGGSSALSISIIGALWKWLNPNTSLDLEKEGEFLISLTRDVESQVLYTPAGLQDYYGAAFGGLQTLNWKIAKNERVALPLETLRELEARTLLFYSGKTRNSGINNWQLFKGLLDKDPEVSQKFNAICEATLAVESALARKNFKDVASAVRREWEVRKTLAPGISTIEMDQAYARAKSITEIAFKVCGAGGGGCFFILLPEKDLKMKDAIRKAVLQSSQIQELVFEAVPHGLVVENSLVVKS